MSDTAEARVADCRELLAQGLQPIKENEKPFTLETITEIVEKTTELFKAMNSAKARIRRYTRVMSKATVRLRVAAKQNVVLCERTANHTGGTAEKVAPAERRMGIISITSFVKGEA